MPSKEGITHLGIIMDGNRRWARSRGLPTLEGHRRGYNKLKEVGDWCIERGIDVLTVFAFSVENWKRSKEEVAYLMELLEFALTKELHEFDKRGVRLRVIGRREGLPESVKRAADAAEERTKNNTKILFQLAVNYGGRAEIIDGVKAVIRAGLDAEDVTEEKFAQHLYAPDVPDPDLIIRTSGEQRLSGFLLWEMAYSELLFVKKHWPEFSKEDFNDVMRIYASRERRFGK